MDIISEISDLDLPWACRTEEASLAPLAKNEVGKTGMKDRDRDREIEEERRGKEKRGGEGEGKRRERRRGERNDQAFFPKGFPINLLPPYGFSRPSTALRTDKPLNLQNKLPFSQIFAIHIN